jgi:hypothetical protein
MRDIYLSSTNIQLRKKISKDKIILISQFFISQDKNRQKEIEFCLKKNSENECIDAIYLLNERIYSDDELGVSNKKIVQININKRLSYKDIFDFIDENNINGYIIFNNSDIFLDDTINNLKLSNMSSDKIFLTLTRYEYTDPTLCKNKLYHNILSSQDTWAIHSKFNVNKKYRNSFDFYFGKPGCDNKILYLMKILGYNIINVPLTIKTYHVHSSNKRTYTEKQALEGPFLFIKAFLDKKFEKTFIKDPTFYTMETITNNFKNNLFNNNIVLRKYIKKCFSKKMPFIIPRFSLIGMHILYNIKNNKNEFISELLDKLNTELNVDIMNNYNTNSYFKNLNDVFEKSKIYISSFDYDPGLTSEIMSFFYSVVNKETIFVNSMNIYNLINYNPWINVLVNKSVLIISNLVDQYELDNKTYDRNVFPKCSIHFKKLNSPYTKNLKTINDDLITEIKGINSDLNYDVALISYGEYGNFICDAIFKTKKSSINVGCSLDGFFRVFNHNNYYQQSSYKLQLVE